MVEITDVKALEPYLLRLTFNDSTVKVIDFFPFLGEGFTKDLFDPTFFRQVKIDSGGGIYWPNGYDVCPNFLHDHVADQEKFSSV